MEHNNALNLSCDFNGYLVCQMTTNMVEVELKIKQLEVSIPLTKTPVLGQRDTIHGTGWIKELESTLRKGEPVGRKLR